MQTFLIKGRHGDGAYSFYSNMKVIVAQTKFEFDRLLCNRSGGECGSSPTLVFVPVLILTITREENKCNKYF
jgi:hypothetical protein